MKTKRQRFAGTVKVGEKGQIVIPKEIRDLFGIRPGDNLLLLADSKRGIAILQDDDIFDQFQSKLGFGPEDEENG